jgi:RNA polymerase sigma-70 factor (ECF subfamily)
MQKTDEQLYQLMKKGNAQAFAELYERREPALYRYALHMTGSAPAAEEVAQEVFVQLMAPNTRFDEARGSLEGWMYGVARNLVRMQRRKAGSPAPVTGEARGYGNQEPAFEHDILGGMIDGENLAALRIAVTELPPAYREAVVLCDLEERNYDEAARLMGCPVGTIRSRLHRARGLLAAKLKRLYAPSYAGAR